MYGVPSSTPHCTPAVEHGHPILFVLLVGYSSEPSDGGTSSCAQLCLLCFQVMLFEGVLSEDDYVGFFPYHGPKTLTHHGKEAYRAAPVGPVGGEDWVWHARGRLRAALWAQQQLLLQCPERAGGVVRAVVRFGSLYFVNLPRALEGEGLGCLTVRQLEEMGSVGHRTLKPWETSLEQQGVSGALGALAAAGGVINNSIEGAAECEDGEDSDNEWVPARTSGVPRSNQRVPKTGTAGVCEREAQQPDSRGSKEAGGGANGEDGTGEAGTGEAGTGGAMQAGVEDGAMEEAAGVGEGERDEGENKDAPNKRPGLAFYNHVSCFPSHGMGLCYL